MDKENYIKHHSVELNSKDLEYPKVNKHRRVHLLSIHCLLILLVLKCYTNRFPENMREVNGSNVKREENLYNHSCYTMSIYVREINAIMG